jgi:peptide/nickel transport system substrate-binding protein
MTGRQWRYGTAAVAVLTLGVASACSSSSSTTPAATGSSASASAAATGSASSSTLSFPRSETLYTSGTAYGPPVNWNPLDTGAFATGTQGLIYEPLYLYDPIKGQYEPWLATGAEASGWQGNTYVINVRSGVTWSDGSR